MRGPVDRVDPHISASLSGGKSKQASTVKFSKASGSDTHTAIQSPASSQSPHDVTSWAVPSHVWLFLCPFTRV